jgi:phosphocarrier protein
MPQQSGRACAVRSPLFRHRREFSGRRTPIELLDLLHGRQQREVGRGIVGDAGLHARAAAKFVHAANRFKSKITLSRDGRQIDGKSILGILMLAAAQGTKLTLRVEGVDEGDACQDLVNLIESKFGEGQ